ncbi:CHAT domain-containing protein [Lewinella sp. LCG006]|uniref:CHAT domain-containing protein n=1 Tax=Lewinella sp. LCG006 TaxID=3231911 RepID=UPI00346022D0
MRSTISSFSFVLLSLLLLATQSGFGQNSPQARQAEDLYEQIMAADGFNEALGYEILGEIYPEYEVLQQADRLYEQAMASDNPEEITQLASQLARGQYRPLRQMQALIQRLRSFPPSDTINRMLAAVLLDYNYLQEGDQPLSAEVFQLLGAPDSLRLADPLDWADPGLALEALLRNYRSPLPEHADPVTLEKRLTGLRHCLELLHFLRRARTTEADRLALAATVPALAHRAMAICLLLHQQTPTAGWWEEAFLLAEQAKSTLLSDQLQGYTADRGDLNWPPLGQQLRLARQLATQSGSFFEQPQRLRELVDQQLPQLSDWPPAPSVQLSLAAVQAQLREQKTLLISYFLLGDEGIVFHLDGEQVQIDHFYWNKETQTALQHFQSEMNGQDFLREPTAAYQRYTKAAYWLYENVLLRPVLRHHRQSAPQKLLLLPDGALWDLPFSALLSRQAPEGEPSYSPGQLDYLVEDYELISAPSALAWLGKSNSALPLHVAALAPEFDGNALANRAACVSPLPALHHSMEEVEAIINRVSGQLFLGNDARLQALTGSRDKFTVWHLATHACRNQDDPSLSALILQDGSLTATQIADLPLQLQLVVLSACETQSGPYRPGEGVLSLGRAFLQGGAQALIGSLWPVSDAATAELMPLFYDALAAGQSSSAALQQAQLSYLAQQDRLSAHPHYWASFVLVGQDQRFSRGSWTSYGRYVLGGIFLVFLIFVLVPRRSTR